MGTFTIQPLGRMGINPIGGLNIWKASQAESAASFLFVDCDSEQNQMYAATMHQEGVGIPHVPIDLSFIGSSSGEFTWGCGLGDFAGDFGFFGVSAVVDGYSSMTWTSGIARGLVVKSRGWEIAIPGVSSGTGTLAPYGTPYRRWNLSAMPRYRVVVDVWRPLATSLLDRQNRKDQQVYWGQFNIITGWRTDQEGIRHGNWAWTFVGKRSAAPPEICFEFKGVWTEDAAGNAILSFDGRGEFCRLNRFSDVLNGTATVQRNDAAIIKYLPFDSNGLLQAKNILWVPSAIVPLS